VRTVKGPALLIAQLASDSPPFNTLSAIAKWAASLGYVGLQLPSSDTRFLDLHRCAESQTLNRTPFVGPRVVEFKV
jgi:hypothetical protein